MLCSNNGVFFLIFFSQKQKKEELRPSWYFAPNKSKNHGININHQHRFTHSRAKKSSYAGASSRRIAPRSGEIH